MFGSDSWWKMRIDCENGYYSFYPEKQQDLFLFSNLFSIELVKNGDHYTYPLLKTLPNYVLSPTPYGLFPSEKTFEGTPKDIMKELDLVYNLTTKTLVPATSIMLSGRLFTLERNWLSERAMIQAGMIVGTGRIRTYEGVFDFDVRKTIVRWWE